MLLAYFRLRTSSTAAVCEGIWRRKANIPERKTERPLPRVPRFFSQSEKEFPEKTK
jgi:hypothetical protein